MVAFMKFAPWLVPVAILTTVAAFGDVHIAETGWGLQVDFPADPKRDEVKTPTELGEQVAQRFYLEQGGYRFLFARFSYPVVPESRAQNGLYIKSIKEMMNSRRGELLADEPCRIGDYDGHRILIAHARDRALREVRQVLIGGCLYVASAEWPAAKGSRTIDPSAERFFASLTIPTAFANPRIAEETARWRELGRGSFRLRYDATRWYRDPSDTDPAIFNFLRTDKEAEAQMILESDPIKSGNIVDSVLSAAKEGADSLKVRKRSKKLRPGGEVNDLEFAVTVDKVVYVNHGFFYSGPAGTAQLRGWAEEKDYKDAEADITELLDGLSIEKRKL